MALMLLHAVRSELTMMQVLACALTEARVAQAEAWRMHRWCARALALVRPLRTPPRDAPSDVGQLGGRVPIRRGWSPDAAVEHKLVPEADPPREPRVVCGNLPSRAHDLSGGG